MNNPRMENQYFYRTPTPPKPISRTEQALLALLDAGTQGLTVFETVRQPFGYQFQHILGSFWCHCLSSYVAAIEKKNIAIARRSEILPCTGRPAHRTRYWIKDKTSALRALVLCNRYREKRGEAPISRPLLSLLLDQFPSNRNRK